MSKDKELDSLLKRTGDIVLNTVTMGIHLDHMEEDIKGMKTDVAMLVNQIPIKEDDVRIISDKTLDVEKSILRIDTRLANLERIIKEELSPDLLNVAEEYKHIKWRVEEASWNKIKFESLKERIGILERTVEKIENSK